MVLGAILGTILGSKSHLKIDQKSDQILDRFWKDVGSQTGSILNQFWLKKSIKNQGGFLIEKRDGHQIPNLRVQGPGRGFLSRSN